MKIRLFEGCHFIKWEISSSLQTRVRVRYCLALGKSAIPHFGEEEGAGSVSLHSSRRDAGRIPQALSEVDGRVDTGGQDLLSAAIEGDQ